MNAKQQLLQNAPLHAKSKSKLEPLQIRKQTVKNEEFFSEITVLKQIAKPVIQNMFTTPIVQRKKIQQDSLFLSHDIDLNSQIKQHTSQLQNSQSNIQTNNQSQNNVKQMQIHENIKQEIKELVSSQLETSDQTQVIRSYQSHTENLNEKQENILLAHEVFTEQSSISIAQQPNNVEQSDQSEESSDDQYFITQLKQILSSRAHKLKENTLKFKTLETRINKHIEIQQLNEMFKIQLQAVKRALQ
ncbi:Hypothetical_protein [Hexamita inflata]|uniref:Hypothetical_protein n=1 Tax=Hexamita inflata TaxID=28002 RepID=A0AA86U377_9EUKA|nr:Hypothetical protein HINF_LOCUS17013 [Hexamita inflata]